MPYWLFKEEPGCYNFDALEREGRTVWDGVANNTALLHLRQVRPGDEVLLYQTGDVKAVVAIMRAVTEPYPDPKEQDKRLVVVDLVPVRRLPRPVTLREIKADPVFAEWDLVRNSRLSVMPVPPPIWKKVIALSKVGDGK